MPYISKERRKVIDAQIFQDMNDIHIESPGELNYVLTKICQRYLFNREKESYSNYNEVIGVIECVKQELYRRSISKYEDKKIKENGDVFIGFPPE